MTLLDKAKKVEERGRWKAPTEEEIEVSLAWMRGEIKLFQINEARGERGGSVAPYVLIARSLRHAYQEGKIKIITKGKK